MQLTVRRNQVLAAIGHQKTLKSDGGVNPIRGQLITIGVDVAHPLRPEFILYRHEEIEKRIPSVGNIGDLVARFLDQRLPDMKWNPGPFHRHRIVGALFRDIVVAISRAQSCIDVLRLHRFDYVTDIDELIVPGVKRQKREIGIFHDIRDGTGGNRRDHLLAERRERYDAVVNLVATRLLVIGDQLFEGYILLLSKTLGPPDLRGRRSRIGHMRPRQGASGGEPERTGKQRTPRQNCHLYLLNLRARRTRPARTHYLPDYPRATARRAQTLLSTAEVALSSARSGISRKSPPP